jgi:alcohol dehydrogenase class IV
MFELRKFVVPEFIFGVGARHKVGLYARNLNAKRVLVVTDPGVIAAGWLAELTSDLDEAGISHALFSQVSPNPRDHEVMAGAEFYRAAGCDVIVALGGGSVIDCAKGISVVIANGGDILDYEGVDAIPMPGPPLICIPTTAGTAADISQFAIINAVSRRTKVAIISKIVVPDVALVDPQTTVTMSPSLTAFSGLDALTHAIEAYVSSASSPLSDVHALAAVRGVRASLRQAVAQPDDLQAREQMMLASLQAGMAFSNASLGATHAMAHSLGGYLDLAHGECNALLLPAVVDFNFHASEDRFIQIGEAMGLEMKQGTPQEKLRRIMDDIHDLRAAVGVAGGLAERGVSRAVVADLADHALNDSCIYTNPRRVTASDLRVIYAEAL